MNCLKTFIQSIISLRNIPSRPPVPNGITRICVSGFTISHHTSRACKIAKEIAICNPEYKTQFYFDTGHKYRKFLKIIKSEFSFEEQNKFAKHKTSPFCWLENSEGKIAIGGRDKLCDWVNNNDNFKNNYVLKKLTTTKPNITEIFFDNTNSSK